MYLHEVPTQVFHHISFWVSVSQSSFDGDCLGGELLFYGNWLHSTEIPYDLVCFLVWGTASGMLASVQRYAVALAAFCVFCLESPHWLAWFHLPSNLHLSWSFLLDFFPPF